MVDHDNVWDRIGTNEFADVVTAAAATFFPDNSPRFVARTPHGYHDEDLIREEPGIAGFTDVTYETFANHREKYLF